MTSEKQNRTTIKSALKFVNNEKKILKLQASCMQAAPKVMPPILLCRPTMSDTVVGEMMGEEGRETITL